MTRPRPDLRYEQALWAAGMRWVAGIDEAGRGALAGPVAAAAVILPPEVDAARLGGVRDSKLMSPREREQWAEVVKAVAVAWAVGYATVAEIDAWGIVGAVQMAARRALHRLWPAPQFLLLDYLRLPLCDLPQMALVKGDRDVLTIAAASVLAKTHRDAWMRRLDDYDPRYGFARHKGYGTAAHREAIARYGLSSYHRRSFRCGGLPPTVGRS